MVVGAKVCELTDGFLWFVCGLYVGILMSPLKMKWPTFFLTEGKEVFLSVIRFFFNLETNSTLCNRRAQLLHPAHTFQEH